MTKAAIGDVLNTEGVLKNSCSGSCQVTFAVKIFEKYLWRNLFIVKLEAKILQFYWKRTSSEVFAMDFQCIFQNIHFPEHLSGATSVKICICKCIKNEGFSSIFLGFRIFFPKFCQCREIFLKNPFRWVFPHAKWKLSCK